MTVDLPRIVKFNYKDPIKNFFYNKFAQIIDEATVVMPDGSTWPLKGKTPSDDNVAWPGSGDETSPWNTDNTVIWYEPTMYCPIPEQYTLGTKGSFSTKGSFNLSVMLPMPFPEDYGMEFMTPFLKAFEAGTCYTDNDACITCTSCGVILSTRDNERTSKWRIAARARFDAVLKRT